MKKRLFAVLLAVLMIASLSTVSAFAAGETPTAITAETTQLQTGNYILNENVTLASLTVPEAAQVTVNLNNHTLTVNGTNSITLTSGASLTFSNGQISAPQMGNDNRGWGTNAFIAVESNSSVTLNGVELDTNGSALYPRGDAASVTVIDSTVKCGVYAVATNAAKVENYGVKITLTNSTFKSEYGYNSTYPYDSCPVMINVEGTLDMNGCTVKGTRQGVIVRAGTATITNCEIETTGQYGGGMYTSSNWGSGDEVPAAAITIGNYVNGTTTTYADDADVTIVNTKITGVNGYPAVYVDSNESYDAIIDISGSETVVTGTFVKGQQQSADAFDISITGGTFVDSAGNKQDVSEYVPDGMEQAADGSIVVDDASVATIGNIGYLTLQAAVDAANDGDTIVLTKNFTIADDEHITLNKRVTIEGANSGITVTGSGTSSLFTLVGGSEGSTFRNFTINYTTSTRDCAAIYFYYGFDGTRSEVTRIQNVNFIGAQTIDTINEEIGILSVYADIDSSVEITDCTFVNFKYAIFINSLDNVTIANNVIDGTKYGGIIIASGERYPVDNLVIDGNILNDICYADYNDPIYGSGISVGPATTNVNISDNSISMIGDKQAIYIDEDSAENIYTVIYTVNGAEYYTTYVSANNGQLIYKAPADPSDSSRFIGWNYGRATVNDSNPNRVVITIGSNDGCVNNTYTFSAVWRTVNIPDAYDIDIDDTSNGSVSTNLSNASAGATITVTVTPDEGYVLGSLTVTGPDGRVDVTRVNATTYTFKMPEGDVTVDATFVREGLPFTDVAANAWYYDAVVYVYNNGLMDGVSNTLFNPDGEMTRAMVWAILARIDGETITGSNWVSEAQSWAVASGVSDGTDANGAVTRQELVTMLWRFAGEPETDATLSAWSDAASVSDWAEAAMAWAVDEGVITGVGASTIDPMGGAIRAQCATILMRSIDKI